MELDASTAPARIKPYGAKAGAPRAEVSAPSYAFDVDECTEDCTATGNGCGETASLGSSCADTVVLGYVSAATSKPRTLLQLAEASQVPVAPPPPSAAAGAPGLTSQTVRHGIGEVVASASRPLTIKTVATTAPAPTFAAQVMHTIAQHAAAAAGPPMMGNSCRSDLSCGAGEDPMGVRQLYSLPSSRAASALGVAPAPPLLRGPREASAPSATTAATGADVFSMERFATFYEAALEELVTECERRVANAPAAWRDSQRHFICGNHNRDLATSTRSFDSPRSGAMSPIGVAPSSVSAGCSTPVYPPCYSNHNQNTHGLHRHSGSTDAASGVLTTAAPLPPPPPSTSRHSRSAFFSATATSPKGPTAAEESVPALLAALTRHHGKMAPMVFIAALAYLARVTVQCASELLSITRENWYRLTTTAILVAAKVYDEHSSSRLNGHFSRSAGIPLSEMTRLELDFLYLIDFDLLLKEAEVEQWLNWMETLAVRRDLMTPLNAYLLGSAPASSNPANTATTTATAAATTTTTTTSTTTTTGSVSVAAYSGFPGSPAPSSSMAGFQLAQYKDHSKAGATCEGSHTAGLSSEGPEHGEDMTLTSPSSIVGPRSFSHARVASGLTAFPGYTNFSRRPTAATAFAAGDAPSFTGPVLELMSMPPRSPISSVVPPNSVTDGACSVLSAASLTGAGPSSLLGRRAVVPPSPVHGVLPLRPATAKSRLFSVVHGTAEPPSPVSVRFLGRLGASPPSPLRPPSQERHSPVRFFKSQGHHRTASGHGLLSTSAATHKSSTTAAAEQPAPVSSKSKTDTRGASGAAASAPAAPAVVVRQGSTTNADTPYNSSSSKSTRWGPLGMVRRVRDVLGVTASLVRGQLNVLAPSSPAEGHGRPPPAQRAALPNKSTSSSGGRTSQHVTATVSSTAAAPYPPVTARPSEDRAAVGLRRPPPYSPPQPPSPAAYRRSPAVRASPHHVDPQWAGKPRPQVAGAAVPGRVSPLPPAAVAAASAYDDAYGEEEDEEEGEWYEEDEECDYGYYDDAGVFHYYEEEEEEEGEYDEEGEWYEEEEEDEAAYFQRCRPPLTHSPPSL